MNPAIIPGWAERAEAAGFSTLGTVGRLAYPGLIDTVALAAAAAATSRIGLVSNVLIATVWPPVLLAKELVGIDAVSGGRLRLGVGVGNRPDDFVVDGLSDKGRGKRFDRDLEIYRSVWSGEPVGGGNNAAVPTGTRQLPMLFGGMAPAAMARMAKWGEGYIGGSVPAAMVAGSFDAARAAWKEAGRDGEPRLIAIAYFGLGDPDKGKANVWDYYSVSGKEVADLIAGNVTGSADDVRQTVQSFAALGAEELIFNPTTDDPNEIERMAEIIHG
jgi:alkanesulfonate monooxygenase SsuD/methylene tetrahydromethanopterin reductase-like flavin-dependent oxidoreductase (luciferase family)